MIRSPTLLSLSLAVLSGCFTQDETMTEAELREAGAMIATTARADAMTGEVVQISTSFTIGAAVQDSLENLRAFYQSQIPCSTLSLSGDTLTLDFGDLADPCTYQGRTYAGIQTLRVVSVEEGEVVLQHGFDGLTDGWTTLEGGATVTWSDRGSKRALVYDTTWADDTQVIDATGALTQALIDEDAGLVAGVRIDGARQWLLEDESWELGIEGVEARGEDPIPQAGRYQLTNPDGKLLQADFARQDEDTIRMTLSSGRLTKIYDVSRITGVEEVE